MGNRETKNIWWYLFSTGYDGWKGKYLFRRYFWNRYVWKDSIGQYVWKCLCPLFGHKEIRNVSEESGYKRIYCFACRTVVADYRFENGCFSVYDEEDRNKT